MKVFPISTREGFTLVEVLIGLIFLAIGILVFSSLQITSVRGNSFSHHLMQATYNAQDGLEYLKSLPVDSPRLQPGNYNAGAVAVSGLLFTRSYVVALNGNVKKIDYSVTWNDGVDHRIVFSTIRSQ